MAGIYSPPEWSVIKNANAFMDGSRMLIPVDLMQYDRGIPILAVHLYQSRMDYPVPAAANVFVRMQKPDGKHVYNPALGVDSARTTVYIAITHQMTAAAGEATAAIEITTDSGTLGIGYVALNIKANPVPEDAIISSDEYKTFDELIKQAQEAAASAASATKSAQTATQEAAKAIKAAQDAQKMIDDAVTEGKRTWSSQKIHEEDRKTWKDAVDSLAPPFSQTGSIVQGHLVEGYPMQVMSHITPTQDGEGDPSPENVRPIKGWDSVQMTVCGGNLMKSDIKFYEIASRTSETTSWNQTAPGEFTGTESGVTVWLSGNYHSGKYSLVFKRNKGFYSIRTYSVATQEELHEYTNQVSISGGYRVDIEETEEFYLSIRPGVFTPSLIISNFMMLARYDSVVTVMPPYAPHSGDEFTTNFSEPVIGGKWEVDTGVVNSDFVNVPIDDLFLASNTNTAFVRIVSSFVGDLPKACGYSNILKRFPGSGAYGGAAQGIYLPDKSTSIDILVSVDNLIPYGAVQGNRGTYLQAAKNYLTTNQAVLIGYNPGKKLQVQPLTVAAKKGITTVYSDTGDTTVTAREDPVYINKALQGRIAALEETLTQMMEVK